MSTPPRYAHRGQTAFTLIELLVVIAIIAMLVGILVPSLSSARGLARSVLCATRQKNLAIGWSMYSSEYDDVVLPGRFGSDSGSNQYFVGNGWKYRPRWVAAMGTLVGELPFVKPAAQKMVYDEHGNRGDRQDYTSKVYLCPSVAKYADERNYAYGYNHQFLGNARKHPSGSGYRNFPIKSDWIAQTSGTVLAADCLGTAAGFPRAQRKAYSNNGKDPRAVSNHGWCLDPPRLTASSDRGTGDFGSPRTAVDPRHMGKATVSFCDGHVESLTPASLGYQLSDDGKFLDSGNNRLFSGDGDDTDPPDVW